MIELSKRVTLFIPNYFNNYSHSNFQWTLTLLDRPDIPTRIQYFSKKIYEEFEDLNINGYEFKKIIFDFLNRKIHIYFEEFNEEALRAIIHSFTIRSSPTSQMFCLIPPNRPKTEQ